MKKLLIIIISIFIISSCSNNEVVDSEETTSLENKVIESNEVLIDTDGGIEFTELENQPDY